ncbi:hypothetical protein N2488_10480 [SAR92 clade bacterium H231]|nr:hypothetical protein [SAR92 clade bacterium H231]
MDIKYFLQKIPMVKSLYYSAHFIIRAVRIRMVLTPIDRQAPFRGLFADTGVFHYRMSDQVLNALKSKTSSSDLDQGIVLESKDSKIVDELFDFIAPNVRAYLGEESFLDGVSWFLSVRNSESISSSWHTDNVGNRLRVFCCVEGDGSQPTHVVASHKRIPRTSTWIKQSCIELYRWAGGRARSQSYRDTIICDHKDGDVYVFDTQLLHRGGYEGGESRRLIFSLEFSNPKKHSLARGPIGTDELNSFKFSESLLASKTFATMLDPKRIKRLDGDTLYYANDE